MTEVLDMLRVVMYFWLGSTAFSLYQLYRDGYKLSKRKSKMITTLTKILMWMSVTYFYLSIVTMLLALGLISLHRISVILLFPVMFPMGVLLTKFRSESIRKHNGHSV